MDKYRKRRAVAVAHEMVDLLAEKGYITYYAENVEEARDKVLELIPKGASVGVGGSETLKAMDMINICLLYTSFQIELGCAGHPGTAGDHG